MASKRPRGYLSEDIRPFPARLISIKRIRRSPACMIKLKVELAKQGANHGEADHNEI